MTGWREDQRQLATESTGRAASLERFDFDFNPKMNRRLVFDLATARFVERHEDALLLGPPGTGKSHLAQALGLAAIQQGHRVAYREAHVLLEELADATLDGTRKNYLAAMSAVPLLILDDLGMRKLPATAAEDLLDSSWTSIETRSMGARRSLCASRSRVSLVREHVATARGRRRMRDEDQPARTPPTTVTLQVMT